MSQTFFRNRVKITDALLPSIVWAGACGSFGIHRRALANSTQEARDRRQQPELGPSYKKDLHATWAAVQRANTSSARKPEGEEENAVMHAARDEG